MSPEELLAELRDAGVVAVEDGRVSIRQQYADTCAKFADRLETADDVTGVLSNDIEPLTDVPTGTNEGVEILAREAALKDLAPDLGRDERLRALFALFQVENPDMPTDGVPENFIPVDGTYLPATIPLLNKGVVYIWLHDCDPCDIMRDDLEDIFADAYEDVLPLGVYGPDSAATLQNEYDIVGGPVTLFIGDGSVDARLQGAHYPGVIESELDSLRSIASTSAAGG